MAWLLGMFDEQLRRALRRSRDPSAALLISLVSERFEDGAWSGVPRFDWELRKAFPQLISLALTPATRLLLLQLARVRPDAIVIAGNETSLSVPDRLRTIVVHHGCAQTHFDRDPEWRGRSPRRLCAAQRAMYQRPNRSFVAPSAWASQQFSLHYGVPPAPVIPHWVPALSEAHEVHAGRKLVLGDFRTWNKGRAVLPPLTARLPQLDIRPLVCTYDTRQAAYARADAYLGLSVSEGGSYALCDAEIAGLPIVMTDVGNYQEFSAARVIPWASRDDIERVARTLEEALAVPRGASFYAQFTFERWRSLWQELVESVRAKPLV
jgi:glycosyltransferase involved in cell wall biosynthesis